MIRSIRWPLTSGRLLAALACAAAVVATLVVDSSTAAAQRIRIRARARAHVHIGGHGHVHIRPYPGPYIRVRPRYYWGWGVRFATPPPPPCYHGCATVSAYYTQPAPAVTVAAPLPPPPPPVPTFGIGVFAGPVDVEGNEYGTDLGLVGRLRLSDHFRLEGELSKTDIEDGARIDRRVGAALLYDFNPYGRFAPYILGGVGVGRAELDGMYGANQGYGELGVGLEWRLTRQFALIGDIRAGQRQNRADEEIQPLVSTTPPPATMDEDENYTRARIGALLYF